MLRALTLTLLLSTAAQAQTVTPSNTTSVEGVFTTGTRARIYAFDAVRGQDYAIGARVLSEGLSYHAEILRPDRRTVLADDYGNSAGEDHDAAFEFRTPSTGRYYLRLTPLGTPGRFTFRLSKDCKGGERLSTGEVPGLATKCSAEVGRTYRDRVLSFYDESDWYRIRLTAGRTIYASTAPSTDLTLYDPRGTMRAASYGSTPERPLRYTVPTSGTYYISVASYVYGPQLYTLTVR